MPLHRPPGAAVYQGSLDASSAKVRHCCNVVLCRRCSHALHAWSVWRSPGRNLQREYIGSILSDRQLSYYNPANFSGDGFTPRFVALEYVLAVMTEFVA